MTLTWTPRKIEHNDWPWVCGYKTEVNGKAYHLYCYLSKSKKSLTFHLDQFDLKLESYMHYDVIRRNAEMRYGRAFRMTGDKSWHDPSLLATLAKKTWIKGVKECLLPEEADYRFCTETQKLLRQTFEPILWAWAEEELQKHTKDNTP